MPANSANLTGTGIDTDGTISSYTWVKIAGPAAGTIVTANAARTEERSVGKEGRPWEYTVKEKKRRCNGCLIPEFFRFVRSRTTLMRVRKIPKPNEQT